MDTLPVSPYCIDLGTLPSPLLDLIWELAGGRPVHPTARIMKVHITRTFANLEDQPSFFEDKSWDLVRACKKHKITWHRMSGGVGEPRGPLRWGKSVKCILPGYKWDYT